MATSDFYKWLMINTIANCGRNLIIFSNHTQHVVCRKPQLSKFPLKAAAEWVWSKVDLRRYWNKIPIKYAANCERQLINIAPDMRWLLSPFRDCRHHSDGTRPFGSSNHFTTDISNKKQIRYFQVGHATFPEWGISGMWNCFCPQNSLISAWKSRLEVHFL